MKKFLCIVVAIVSVLTALPVGASAQVSAPAVVSNLTVVKSGSGAKVYWSKLSGASGYRVYRRTGSSGSYKLIKTTTAVSHIDNGISKGKTYYYTVRAYKLSGNSRVYGKRCSPFSFNLSWVHLSGSGVGGRAKASVNKKYIANSKLSTATKFTTKPSTSKPFAAGKLTQSSIDNTLSRVNYYRWLCGLKSVSYNSSYSTYNQWGAVLMHNIGYVTHSVSVKPSGMSSTAFKKAQKGISASSDSSVGKISGNCWKKNSVVTAIDGFVNDNDSSSPTLISHRSALLDPACASVSFGATSSYIALSTFGGATGNTAKYYSFPSAGYFPVQSINTSAPWSIRLAKDISTTSSTSVTLYYKGKSYKVSKIYNTSWYWYSFDFYLPSELKNAITKNGSFKDGVVVTVKVNGLKTGSSSSGWICYRVRFFKAG